MALGIIRNDWTEAEITAILAQPFNDLLFNAHTVHRQYFSPHEVQVSTLLSIKTGACPEDCAYCSQSGHFKTNIEKQKLLDKESILAAAEAAKACGASRFCMGAAWRQPPDHQFPQILEITKAVKALGLETCMTLGMLTEKQAQMLQEAGLDYYNHNLDTSPEYYEKIITTRTYEERLKTLEHVRNAGIHVCCGGIMGMGETREDRVRFLQQLVNLPEHPRSVPINRLIAQKGTPLEDTPELDNFEFIRVVATARILMPKSHVRLSAGRGSMNDETQALCFFAGANSIHYGEKLLTSKNNEMNQDQQLFERLNLKNMPLPATE